MSLLADLNALAANLGTAIPAANVGRSLTPAADINQTELTAGVFTLITMGETLESLVQRDEMDGTVRALLTYQGQLSEGASAQAIEDHELAVVAAVKTWIKALPATLPQVDLISWQGSGQLEHPYASVVFELTLADYD